MIKIYRKSSTSEMLDEIPQPDKGSWVNIVAPSKDEITEVSTALRVDPNMLRGVLDEEERPRVEKEDGSLLIVIRVPFIDDKKILSVIPLGIVITEDNIITVSSSTNCVLDDFMNMKVRNFYTTKRTRFLLQIFSRTNHHYKKYLDFVEKSIEEGERSIMKSFKNEEIVELLNLQKQLVFMSTAVVSNEKALDKILNGKMIKLYDEDKDLLEDIIIENKESIEMVNIYSNILSNTMDAYASLVSNNLNVVMKFLASVTIILAIPTIVASFYGMNVPLPFEDSPHAFLIVAGISLTLIVVATIIFVVKKYF